MYYLLGFVIGLIPLAIYVGLHSFLEHKKTQEKVKQMEEFLQWQVQTKANAVAVVTPNPICAWCGGPHYNKDHERNAQVKLIG